MLQCYTSAGIVGPLYSGKTEIRRVFEQTLCYKGISHSQILREEIGRRQLPMDRDSFTRVYQELVERYGHDILARLTLERVPARSGFVVDGIRHPAELEYCRGNVEGFFSIGVDVSENRDISRRIRYNRMLEMGRDIDRVNWEGFVERDMLEWGGVSDLYNIEETLRLVDFRTLNNRT